MFLALVLDRLDHLGNDDIEVADDAVVRDLEDRRVLVRVDRDDLRGVLHAGEVLDRARDAAGDEERGTDRDAGLPDLALVLAVAEVDRRAGAAHGAAEGTGEVVQQLEVLLRADAGSSRHDDARALQVDAGHLANDLDDLHGDVDAGEMRVVIHARSSRPLLRLERLHDALADPRHLRPLARVDDRRDDVAAERRTDLLEDVGELLSSLLVLVVVDLQVGAVRRQSAAERGSDGRREVAAHVRRPEDHDLGILFLDQLHERMAVRLAAIELELGILDEMDDVRAGLEEVPGEALDLVSHQDGRELDAQPVREFTSLAEQFLRDVREMALFLFGINPHFTFGTIHKSSLADRVVRDQVLDESVDAGFGRRDFLVVAAGEHDRDDLVHRSRGPREAAAVADAADAVAREALGLEGLVLHDAADVRRTQLAELVGHREERRELHPRFLDAGADVAGRKRVVAVDLEALEIGDGREVEVVGDLGAGLGRVAVDGLASAEDEVGIEPPHGLGQDVARRERVGAGGPAVGHEIGLVGAAVERLAEDLASRGKAHRDRNDLSAVLFLDLKRGLKGVAVFGIEDRRQRRAVDGAVGLHRLTGHLLRVGDLLDADDTYIASFTIVHRL